MDETSLSVFVQAVSKSAERGRPYVPKYLGSEYVMCDVEVSVDPTLFNPIIATEHLHCTCIYCEAWIPKVTDGV